MIKYIFGLLIFFTPVLAYGDESFENRTLYGLAVARHVTYDFKGEEISSSATQIFDTNFNEVQEIMLDANLVNRGWRCARNVPTLMNSGTSFGFYCFKEKSSIRVESSFTSQDIGRQTTYGSLCEDFNNGTVCVKLFVFITDDPNLLKSSAIVRSAKKKTKHL